jgi:adenosylcobinamide kinase/adenosylcobinamide-phosphate guanylyltransferase
MKVSTEIILLTGGARSGKSKMALQLAGEHSPKIFVATAEALDEEMKKRIQLHRSERNQDWITIEEPISLTKILKEHPEGVVVLDCITLWLSNLLMRSFRESEIEIEIVDLCKALEARQASTIVVANEVGLGIVPEHPSGRQFRDLAGLANQRIAKVAHRVILMVSGLSLSLK